MVIADLFWQCPAGSRCYQVYGLATRVEKIMDSMGFVPADADLPVGSFSGTPLLTRLT